jgi:hypothetical protein
MPTINDLRAQAAESARLLADAEAEEAARPAMPPEDAVAITAAALEAHTAASSHEEKHKVAETALRLIEDGKHKGREVDILAQHVIDAREAMGGVRQTIAATDVGEVPANLIEGAAL